MRLYYENAYLTEFSALATGCEATKNGYAITLDRTAFYPEGGGQPSDTGFIGPARVTSVHERNGKIAHYAEQPVEVGTRLDCVIDWERRFSLMQGHTGEHILSGILKSNFGLANVGFHMGSEFVTIDVDGVITEDSLQFAETLANRAIYENVPVEAGFKSEAELEEIDYRSKGGIKGDVRIVRIGGYDTCACCGVHCAASGEIGLLKIIGHQKYKQGTRIFLLCGIRAFEDYAAKSRSVRDISVLLSSKPSEVTEAVEQLREENANLGRSLHAFKSRVISQAAERIPYESGCVCIFENGLNPDELRRLCLLISERAELSVVLSGESPLYKYAIGSKTLDVRQLTERLNKAFSGRGGGKKELTQGSINGDTEAITAFINAEHGS